MVRGGGGDGLVGGRQGVWGGGGDRESVHDRGARLPAVLQASEYRFMGVHNDGAEGEGEGEVLSGSEDAAGASEGADAGGSGEEVSEEEKAEQQAQADAAAKAAADQARAEMQQGIQALSSAAVERVQNGEDPAKVLEDMAPEKIAKQAGIDLETASETDKSLLEEAYKSIKAVVDEAAKAEEAKAKALVDSMKKERAEQEAQQKAMDTAIAASQESDPKKRKELEEEAQEAMQKQQELAEAEGAVEAAPEPPALNMTKVQEAVDAAADKAADVAAKEERAKLDAVVQPPVVTDFSPEAIRKAEIEISSVFSGIVSSLLSNLLTQNPEMVRRSMVVRRMQSAAAAAAAENA